jgi:Transposase DDE domain
VKTTDTTAPITEYIETALPWAHGHQVKGIVDYVEAILERQTGNQAELARGMGNQEAALKRLSRLIHNERLDPRWLAEAILDQAIEQIARRGKVRLAIDWTIEDDQHLLVVSLVTRGRGVPIFWRAYAASVLKGRMKVYEMAILKRVLERVRGKIGRRRLIVTADRGFADVALGEVLDAYGVEYVIRTKSSTKVCVAGQWQQLQQIAFITNSRRRNLGQVSYCQSNPRKQWVSLSRIKNEKGEWEVWYLISNRWHTAAQMAGEYARRFGCEQGFRDVKRLLGFADARIADTQAWSRFFALFAFALLILICLAVAIFRRDPKVASQLLRRITSRRRDRCELSLVNATLKLLEHDPTLFLSLDPHLTLDLEPSFANVS